MVRDDDNARINFFSAEGALIEDWSLSGGFGTSRQSFVTSDGTLYSPEPVSRDPQTNRSIWGMVPYGPGGEPGEPIPNPNPPDFDALRFPASTVTMPDGRQVTGRGGLVPFSPRTIAEFLPAGAIIAGTSDQYRMEVRHFDGRVLVIERTIKPVPVSSEEAAWTKRYITALRRRSVPTWSWDGPDIPEHKGFFELVVGDPDGRVWVSRTGPGVRADECDENPEPKPASEITRCWENTLVVDVFGSDGHFLGDVEMPPGFGVYELRRAFISGDMVLIQSEDEAGTIMVKRYRLVLPGER